MKAYLMESAILSTDRILEGIYEISRYHRIQGSKELLKAIEYISKELDSLEIEHDILEESYDGESWCLTLKSPLPWNLKEKGRIKVNSEVIQISRNPLAVMPGSPPGKVKAEVVHIRQSEDWKRAKGKAVLVKTKWANEYEKAIESGVSLFIAYREGTGEAFPYIGLFSTKDDLRKKAVPAITLSEKLAKEIIKKIDLEKKVIIDVSIETEFGERETMPILLAKIGTPPYIVFTSHICHPKPGANDNASGASTVLEIARAIKKLYNENFRFGFIFLWIPEYYGTSAFMERYAKAEEYYCVLNFDMVGGSSDRSGSRITLRRTPLSRFSIISGVMETFLAQKGRSCPYMMGSDHDIFNFFGVPSIMAITLPDKYYHTSEDSPEKLSKSSLSAIGRAGLATALFLSKASRKELKRFSRGYVMKVIGEALMKGGSARLSKKLIYGGLSRDSKFLGLRIGKEIKRNPWLRWERRGVLLPKSIRFISKEAGEMLKEFLEREKENGSHLHELLMLGEILPRRESLQALKEEFGSEIEEKELLKLIDALESANFLKFP